MVPVKAVAILAFTITAILYFMVPHTFTVSPFVNIVVKCAPVLCLMWFVFLHMSSDNVGNSCSKRIFMGLLFSCIGDALLILDNMFIQGMASFALAQLFYISALGFDELQLRCGIFVYTLCALITPSLLPSSDIFLRCCILVYSFLLATMGWRSLAKFYHEGSTSWNRMLVGAGGMLWMVSDATLAYNEFIRAFPSADVVPYSSPKTWNDGSINSWEKKRVYQLRAKQRNVEQLSVVVTSTAYQLSTAAMFQSL